MAPAPPRPFPPARRLAPALVLVLALTALVTLLPTDTVTPSAGAAVVPHHGFRATVMGWSSWYGSYQVGGLGSAWCIDHGQHPPDDAFGYAPTGVAGIDDDTNAALAWAVTRHGQDDAVQAAAVMLALHDLMGAQYPFGRMDVHALGLGDLAGFGGHEGEIIGRARAIRDDALAHRHLRGPLHLTVEATPVRPGEPGTLSALLVDAAGNPVAGSELAVSAHGAALTGGDRPVTGPDGRAAVGFEAVTGPNRFHVATRVPDPALDAWGPTAAPAQRVARPRHVDLAAETTFDAAPPTGRVRVDKTGDATAYVPIAGARFELRRGDASGPVVTTFTIGEDGRSETTDVEPGEHTLVEVRPPPGYEPAGPIPVQVRADTDQVVDVHDRVERAQLALTKVDAVTDEVVAGAELTLDYDRDGDGRPDERAATIVTGDEPTVLPDLLPGDYLVTEVTAPDGYRPLGQPIPLTLYPGQPAVLRLPNEPRATVAFEKHPVGGTVPDDVDLGGAVFVVDAVPTDAAVGPPSDPSLPDTPVTGPAPAVDDHEGGGEELAPPPLEPSAPKPTRSDGPGPSEPGPTADLEVGTCTTDARGRCALPDDALVGGRRYCWREVEAPTGFGLAEPACFTAGAAGSTLTVAVAEPVLPEMPPDTVTTAETPPRDTPPRASTPGPTTPRPTTPALPRTGNDTVPLVVAGAGLVIAGSALVALRRRRLG